MHRHFCPIISSKPQLTRVDRPLSLMKSRFDYVSLRHECDGFLLIIVINLVISKPTDPLVSVLFFCNSKIAELESRAI